MSLMKIFGSKRKDLAKTIDESEAGEDFTPDCPAIIELQQDKQLGKELNLQTDENYYTLEDLLTILKLSKTKSTKCSIIVNKIDDSTIHFIFNEGKVILKSDFTYDWEV